uniref:Uncharacterized protein n=1 Tax=Arundo donax TaxID=35708 RepID=A0A0A9ATQ5_ARUDO
MGGLPLLLLLTWGATCVNEDRQHTHSPCSRGHYCIDFGAASMDMDKGAMAPTRR